MPVREVSLVALMVLVPGLGRAAEVSVSTSAELRAAASAAHPGDTLRLGAGEYRIDRKLSCNASGTAEAPIRVVGADGGASRVVFHDASGIVEGFHVFGGHWSFENLTIEGDCSTDSRCEHAFHIAGDADGTRIVGNVVSGFNAHIKANGEGDPRLFPDDVLVEGNELFNPAARQTSNPVTPVDVVGGRRWVVRANYVHDFEKGQGNRISYGMFLKGNGVDGVFERNLVVCEQLHSGGIRLGLSFGGGGTGPDSICEDGTCNPEHRRGIMRNNIIAHCPSDVYVNECEECTIEHNTLYDCTGIDVRFSTSSATVRRNVLSGRVRSRDSATVMDVDNLAVSVSELDALFTDPAGLDFSLAGATASIVDPDVSDSVSEDFCAVARDSQPDWGALEYGGAICDTRRPVVVTTPVDGGTTDAGVDGGTEIDGGPAVDMGMTLDAGADAGVSDVGGTVVDAGAQPEEPPAEDDGCRCAAFASTSGSWSVLLGLAGLLGLGRARTRR